MVASFGLIAAKFFVLSISVGTAVGASEAGSDSKHTQQCRILKQIGLVTYPDTPLAKHTSRETEPLRKPGWAAGGREACLPAGGTRTQRTGP
jgi:hypothetical protein